MTRINTVPVTELTDQHLLAEYKELPRVFTLASKASESSLKESWGLTYRMGQGHVKFFYTRLRFCRRRYDDLVSELKRRGYSLNPVESFNIPNRLDNDWTPSNRDLEISRERIKKRLRTGKVKFTYYGEVLK